MKLSVLLLGLVVLVGGGWYAYRQTSARNAVSSVEEKPLQTAKAIVGDLVLYANGTGTVMPTTESSFGFKASGQVSEIDVQIGDWVQAGEVLAQLDDTAAKIEAAKAQEAVDKLTSAAAIATAEQTLANAQSEFVTAKANLEYLISPEVLYWEEKVVERQGFLSDIQTASQNDTSDAAKQKVTDAEAALKFAQDSLTYFQKAYESDYVPATFTQYRTVRTPFGTRTEVVKVVDEETGAKSNLIYPPTEGEIGMARAAYDLAKATVAEAQTYLDVLNGAEISEGATGANLVTYIKAKHALEKAEYNLQATRLIAPINGTVTALDMTVGDLVSGSSVITISELDQPYSLDVYLDAEDWSQVRVGYEVDVTFDVIPDQVFKGTVTNIYPTLDTSSSNSALVHITARLNEALTYELPSGSAASVDVVGGKAQHAVLVPVEAIHEIGDGAYTLFVMENGKLRLRRVDVGLQDLTKAEIVSGLDAGDIVTTGVVETK
jgi:RND family efflux transporter MFP subunit